MGSGGGGLTALVFAAREGDLDSAKLLLDAGADINQTTEYGWTPLLTAVNNRNYTLAAHLIERGADVNLANKGGWTPLYLATDNRNIEGGDYPVPKPDLDHLEIIRRLLERGADPNIRVKDNTLTRTIFTMQWFFEAGATAFVRAAHSGDTELLRLLLEARRRPESRDRPRGLRAHRGRRDRLGRGRDLRTVAAGQPRRDHGCCSISVSTRTTRINEGRTPLMGAALKGRNDVVQLLVDARRAASTRATAAAATRTRSAP